MRTKTTKINFIVHIILKHFKINFHIIFAIIPLSYVIFLKILIKKMKFWITFMLIVIFVINIKYYHLILFENIYY